MPRKPIDPTRLTQEQLLMHQVWKRAAEVGELELRFATKAEAHRMRFTLYNAVKPVRDGRFIDETLLCAVRETSIQVREEPTMALPWVLKLTGVSTSGPSIAAKIALGQFMPVAQLPAAPKAEELPQPPTAAPAAQIAKPTAAKELLALDEIAAANRILAQAQPETPPVMPQKVTPYFTRD